MEMKKKMKKVLSLVLILTMIMATWIGAMPSQAVQAATKPALNKTSVNVLVGKSTKLKLKKKITGAKISWKSKNKKIATVVKSGKVTGVRKGNTKITANVSVSGKKYKLNCKVKVVQKAKKIQITYNNGKTASPIELKVGGKIQLNAKPTSPKGSNDYISSWKSKSGKIATVNKKGEVVAVAAGETTITATAFGKAKASIKVRVVGNNVTPSPIPTLKPTPSSSVEPSSSPSPVPSEDPSASPTSGGSTSPSPYPNDADLPDEIKNGEKQVLYTSSFETDLDGFGARPYPWGGNGVSATRADGIQAKDGNYSIYVTGRTQAWHGTQMNVTGLMTNGNRYFVRGYVRQDTGKEQEMKISLEYVKDNQGVEWPEVAIVKCQSGVWTQVQGYVDVKTTAPSVNLYFEMPSSEKDNFYVDDVTIWGDLKTTPVDGYLKEAYAGLNIPIGVAINNRDFSNTATLNHVLEQYNSFTLENEMKPDAVLGLNQRISVEQAQADGYVIPENYKESTVPKLNFDTIDKVLKSAYDNGLKMRAHTLVWHSQTPAWFFNKDYSSSGTTLVSPAEMDARMEFYIRTVMKHVYDSQYSIGKDGEVIVYAWDVVNEYLNNTGRGWTQVYGDQKSNASPKPEFVKKAFTIAKDVINEYEFGDGIGLFYNDFNTYDNTSKIVNMIKYINEDGKVCDGVGMQCHLDVDYPSVDKVGSTIDAFKNAGFEIQITELDVTINFDYTKPNLYLDKGQTNAQQSVYFGNLMKMLIQKKMGGANITGITWWGLHDVVSWRSVCQPLLFGSNINDPKPSFSAVIEAASIIGGQ